MVVIGRFHRSSIDSSNMNPDQLYKVITQIQLCSDHFHLLAELKAMWEEYSASNRAFNLIFTETHGLVNIGFGHYCLNSHPCSLVELFTHLEGNPLLMGESYKRINYYI